MISPTELKLLNTYRTTIIPVSKLCDDHLGVTYAQACRLADQNLLPFPTFRLGDARTPLFVGSKDLAAFLDETTKGEA